MNFNTTRNLTGGMVAGIGILAVILFIISVPITFFFGWLFGNIAVFFFGSTITAVFTNLGLNCITATNFPIVCAVLGMFFHIIMPGSGIKFNSNKD